MLMPCWWACNDFNGEYSKPCSNGGMVHMVRYPNSSAATKYFNGSEYPPVISRVIAGTRRLALVRWGSVSMSCTQCRLQTPGSWQRCTSFRSQISYLDRTKTFHVVMKFSMITTMIAIPPWHLKSRRWHASTIGWWWLTTAGPVWKNINSCYSWNYPYSGICMVLKASIVMVSHSTSVLRKR